MLTELVLSINLLAEVSLKPNLHDIQAFVFRFNPLKTRDR